MSSIQYKTIAVDSVKIFYREAGSTSLPNLLLLHGHGSASHTFRNLIPLLNSSFHVIAPDYPGFGQSDMPSREQYSYTFINIASTIAKFTEKIGIAKRGFAIYVFDYGAPIGFNIAIKHPERITGIISQSGNAYAEGLGDGFAPHKLYWAEPSNLDNRQRLTSLFQYETIQESYALGVNPAEVNPDAGVLDYYYNQRQGALDIQLDLQLDYEQNVIAYPKWQAYLREYQPKLVAIWGDKDPFFRPSGAEAYKRDVPQAYVTIVDGAHYLNEYIPDQVASVARMLL